MGADVLEFEGLLEAYFGRSVACVGTGTAAVHLALQACGVGPGDEVLVPSLTYVATYQAISATGATPVSVDVLDSSLTMDPADAERRVTARTKAIVPVHYGGGISELDKIHDLARVHGLRVIEDAAHAFGSMIVGSRVGSVGDVVCFSFDPIKNLTSGEGGCVVSADEAVMQEVRDARLLGVRGDSQARNKERRLYEFEVDAQGWRYHMSNINAAIGKVQFARFDETATTRRTLAKVYDGVFRGSTVVQILPNDYDEVVPHIYVVRFVDSATRDRVKKGLLDELNVETALHYFPNHFLSKYRREGDSLPVTEQAFGRMLTIPLHTKLDEGQVERIGAAVLRIAGAGALNQ
jgi:dTDP-4-amino-4,6-dideoxygalactose transaminase